MNIPDEYNAVTISAWEMHNLGKLGKDERDTWTFKFKIDSMNDGKPKSPLLCCIHLYDTNKLTSEDEAQALLDKLNKYCGMKNQIGRYKEFRDLDKLVDAAVNFGEIAGKYFPTRVEEEDE